MKNKIREEKHFYLMLAVVIVYLLFLVITPQILNIDSNKTDLSQAFISPGAKGHPFGTDNVGRDVFARILNGGVISVYSAILTVGIVFIVGTIIGTVSGFIGGTFDNIIMKIVTVFQAFPSFVLAIAIAGILGQGLFNGILALSLVYWVTYARLSRSLVLSIKDSIFVQSARVCGADNKNIILKYMLPNMLPTLAVTAALDVGNVILSMAGLSFLGLGAARPTSEWGAMMSEARTNFQTQPWTIVFPGIALFIAVIVFNLFGDSIRDMIDKKTRFDFVPDRKKRKKWRKT